jgi:hypothetical protein
VKGHLSHSACGSVLVRHYHLFMTTGELAPDLTFLQPDGTPVRLSAFLNREFLLLVFLRHLA